MTKHTLFCSTDVQEIYRVYQALSESFLKAFKQQAEFRISTVTSGKDFCLDVEDVTETQHNWLKTATLEILEKKSEKSLDQK